jgi:hypothetical protein
MRNEKTCFGLITHHIPECKWEADYLSSIHATNERDSKVISAGFWIFLCLVGIGFFYFTCAPVSLEFEGTTIGNPLLQFDKAIDVGDFNNSIFVNLTHANGKVKITVPTWFTMDLMNRW